jgi:hypothetical protein
MRARIEELDDKHDVHVYEANLDDIEVIRQHCKHMRDTGQIGDPDMRNYGLIPKIFIQMYMNNNGVSWADFCRVPDHYKRLLNDPALKDFRIYEGRA